MNNRLWRLICGLALIAALVSPLTETAAAKPAASHGLSAFGELKYGPDFTHFDYVNPNAPKGGRLSMIGTAGLTTFNSFNNFILKGDAAQGLGFLFDTLMASAADEPDSVYGLVAANAIVAVDKKSVVFNLRKQARFSDGSRLTADDVVFSFTILKEKGHPAYKLQLKDVVKVEKLSPYQVRYSFKGEQLRDLPRIIAVLPIL